MSFPTFPATPGPVFPVSSSSEPLLLSVQFGDGYQQETLDGINSKDVASQDVRWDLLTDTDHTTFEAFLTANGGGNAGFLYTLPSSGKTYHYNCEGWQWTLVAHNNWSLAATFKRVFNPS